MFRVLLVAKNRVFREAFKENFTHHYPSVLTEEAADGDEALQKVGGIPPDLIFMDIRLRGLNGLQLTQKIKRDFPNTHIAILTGYDLPEFRQAALQYGPDRFFVKTSL